MQSINFILKRMEIERIPTKIKMKNDYIRTEITIIAYQNTFK